MLGRDRGSFRAAARTGLRPSEWWGAGLFAALLLSLIVPAAFLFPSGNNHKDGGLNRTTKEEGHTHSFADQEAAVTAHYTRSLAYFTFWLIVVGGAQVIALSSQIFLLIKADQRAKEAENLARTQIALSHRQVDLEERRHGLDRTKFIATNSPRVILRDVFIVSSADNALVTEGRSVSFLLVNVGATEARIIESWVILEWRDRNTKTRNMPPRPTTR